MKFAHIADVHIGCWREAKIAEAPTQAFLKACDVCIEHKVDFILIAGDLFNTQLPGVDRLKTVILKLREVAQHNIPVYFIPGSHDFSPSGKTMLDVIEAAQLGTNVVRGDVVDNKLKLKFTVDKKTGAKITGILGKRGMLDKKFYEQLEREWLAAEPGFKIFMFHTALTEFKPKGFEQMDSMTYTYMPKNFNYYAGGHVHVVLDETVPEYGRITMPGALFPCNFKELEKHKHGGFYMYDDCSETPLTWVPIKLYDVESFTFSCDNKTPEQVYLAAIQAAHDTDFTQKIVTLRFKGMLDCNRITELDFKKLFEIFYDKGAHLVIKNTAALSTQQFEEIKVTYDSVQELESALIKEHLANNPLQGISQEEELALITNMLTWLNIEKNEGEKVIDFEERLKATADEAYAHVLEEPRKLFKAGEPELVITTQKEV